MLKNFLKKLSFFYLLLGVGISIGGYYYYFVKQVSKIDTNTNTNTIEIVGTGNLSETIDVVGTAELVDEQSLSFNKSGTIKSVFFKAGDKIKKGDIIAELDNTNGEISIKEAQISLDNAKINLQELYSKVDDSKVLQSKNTIENTKTSIENAKKELENLKITQTNSINENKKNIENLQKDLQISKDVVLVSKNELETSKNELEISKNELEISKNELGLAKKDLELSKKDLELGIAEQSKDLSNTNSNKSTTIKQIENNFASDLTSISKIIEQADYILGVSEANKTKNDDFESYLGAKNSSYKQEAETSLHSSIKSFENLKQIVDGYDKSGEADAIKFVLEEFKKTYSILETTTSLVYKTLENTVSSANLTESDIENKKSTMYNYLTTIQNKSNSITSSINTLNTLTDTNLIVIGNNNTISSKENTISSKENTISSKENAIDTKENTISSKENAISSKESSIKSSLVAIEKKETEIENQKINLATTMKNNELTIKNKADNIKQLEKTLLVNEQSFVELLEGPTEENVKKAQNSITQAELKLKSAKESLDDYKLEAPFDGIVRKIDYMVGDNLSTEVDKYVYIENPNLLEIKVMLDQVDIGKVEVGTKAKIKFDAYLTEKVNAVISQIDTTPVQSSGVTSYTVTIILNDKDFNKKVLSGMTANVEILTSEVENAILVSSKAITTKDDKNFVTTIKNGQEKQKEVIIGIASSGKTQIVSGVSVGDEIVIKTYTSDSSSKTTSTSLFSPPTNRNRTSGGMGGPPGGF